MHQHVSDTETIILKLNSLWQVQSDHKDGTANIKAPWRPHKIAFSVGKSKLVTNIAFVLCIAFWEIETYKSKQLFAFTINSSHLRIMSQWLQLELWVISQKSCPWTIWDRDVVYFNCVNLSFISIGLSWRRCP